MTSACFVPVADILVAFLSRDKKVEYATVQSRLSRWAKHPVLQDSFAQAPFTHQRLFDKGNATLCVPSELSDQEQHLVCTVLLKGLALSASFAGGDIEDLREVLTAALKTKGKIAPAHRSAAAIEERKLLNGTSSVDQQQVEPSDLEWIDGDPLLDQPQRPPIPILPNSTLQESWDAIALYYSSLAKEPTSMGFEATTQQIQDTIGFCTGSTGCTNPKHKDRFCQPRPPDRVG